MDGTNVNGGNAKVARNVSNLDGVSMPDLQESENKTSTATADMDGQEVNGDLKGVTKKTASTAVKTKLRKFKANSTSSIENDANLSTRGRKRKLSEPDDASSEESTEFNGFDSQGVNDLDTGSHVLKKLIAEAEVAEAELTKRYRYSVPKKNFDGRKDDDQDSDDNKIRIFDMDQMLDIDKIKKERESDKSETESIGVANSVESETDQLKTEESSAKSVNSSSTTSSPSAISLKSKGSRLSRGASPGSALKQKATVDITNPAFKEPFKYGWKRELVFRASNDSSLKRMADIYYYTPKGKKVRSFREVAECLNSKELTIDNFTFFKEPLGLDDPEKEIIRDARRIRGSMGSTATPPRRSFGGKKVMSARKTVEQHVAAATPPSPVVAPTPVAVSTPSAKAAAKSPKTASAGFKVKVPAKKTPQIKIKTPSEESEMLPPQRNAASTRRSQQPVEKAPPVKSKRLLTPKVQEPCSIRCSTSMGLIPSLQCRVCLCLYHPECVDGLEFSGSDDYICKNCQQDSTETHQHQSMNPSLTPPPLIPISMLGAQNAKQKPQTSLTPPKLQRIPKSESTDVQSRNATKFSKTATTATSSPSPSEKKESTWFPQSENEFMQSHDGILPKPAQNIALMGGKRYIVVPKNNAMAVQPAITVKPDKIGDKPPMLQESSLIDVSNTMENTDIRVSPSTKISDVNETTENIYDREFPRDVSTSCTSSDDTNEMLDSNTKTNTSSASISENKISNVKAHSSVETRRTSTRSPSRKTISSTATQNNISTFGVDSEVTKTNIKQVIINTNVAQMGNRRKQNQQESDLQHHFMDSVCAGYHALLRIFQYLKVQELLRAARVCKMWRDLAAHPSLWKTVRMKNSQVTDWDGLADTLQRRGTQHLDLRKMLVAGESDGIWKKFLSVIPRVTSLVKLELCRCPVMVVEEVIKSCPQLQVLSAMSIKCDSLNLQSVGNLKSCQELRLKAISGMSLQEDLTPLQELTQLTQLSLTSVKELGKKRIDIIQTLVNLETLELGECSDFPDKFGTAVLIKLQKLERLRLEKGQGSCCTFDILEGVSKLENLSQMELVNFDVKNGFDKCLANCKNIKRLLIIPTYISQSATSNNMVLGGVTELSNNLTHFVWGVTLELLRVTELFVDQCNLMNKQVTGDSIPVLKPVPCLKLIEDVEDENENQKGEDKQLNMTSPQVDILPLPQLQKLLLTALPKTRVKILKIPFHATWRQSISDTATQ
ncbi:hypothetical protein KPH14_001573 [Odynerus spinipes]|uniref:F-box/LRR-repeat protein 7 n=1 Tax=Odynerus spinipes TaxID=1348599 RepID=A0AAD9RZK4_9HYME|nr:hypothetical protein KPH14_001573 [Odynerus spinipes]